jgi:hypothetical protein
MKYHAASDLLLQYTCKCSIMFMLATGVLSNFNVEGFRSGYPPAERRMGVVSIAFSTPHNNPIGIWLLRAANGGVLRDCGRPSSSLTS